MHREIGLFVAFEADRAHRQRPGDGAFADRRHHLAALDLHGPASDTFRLVSRRAILPAVQPGTR